MATNELRDVDRADRFSGPWFDSRTAMAYVPCKSLNAWYAWRSRHGIIPRANGSVAKADLDRELKRRKRTRVMHPKSLANLSHARQSVARPLPVKSNSLETEHGR